MLVRRLINQIREFSYSSTRLPQSNGLKQLLSWDQLEDLVNDTGVILISTCHVGIPRSEQPRKKRPPPATPLDFPSYTPKGQSPGFLADDVDLFSLFSLPRKLDDLNEKHVSVLNLNVDRDVALCMLIPQCHLPPITWESDPAHSGGSDAFPATPVTPATLSNGLAVPGHDVFFARMKELFFDNDDAFRFINREPSRPGRAVTKVAQFRKFFEALYAMSEYWDTSLDIETTPTPTQTTPPEDVMDIDQHRSESQALDIENDKEPYTGRRISTGRDMPRQYREDAVKSLVETIAWCFRCQVSNPRNHAKLKLKNMFLPVHQTAMVYRPPQDRQRARQGFVEGPLMAIQCRAETVFTQADEKQGEGQAEIVDLLREVGAMLLLAQERARDGKTEVTPGTDQWWATAPRWGGAPGGEVGSAEATNSDDAPPPAQKEDEEAPKDKETARLEDKKRRKLEKSRLRKTKRVQSGYHTLQAPASTWDKRTTYAQIGKDEGSEYDDVSLSVTSIITLRGSP